MKKTVLIFFTFMAFVTGAFAQASASASASATVVTPIAITKTVDMSFGNVAVQTSLGGNVVLTPSGTRTKTGGVTLPNVTGTVSAASFNVTGNGNYTYIITLPSSDVTITSGTNSMTFNNFTSTPSGTGSLTSGSQTLTVGATLNVGAAQPAGTYITGTPFDVIVNYN